MDNIIQTLLYLAVFTCPMGADPKISISTPVGMMSPFRICILLAALLSVLMWVGRNIETIIYNEGNSYSVKFYLFWWASSLVSCIWTLDKAEWFRFFFFQSIGLVAIILFLNNFTTASHMLHAFRNLYAGILMQGAFGFWETITGKYYWEAPPAFSEIRMSQMPIAMQRNPNDFATLMLLGVTLSLLFADYHRNKSMKVMNYALIALEIYLITRASSRANMIALIILFTAYFAIYRRDKLVRLLMVLGLVMFISPYARSIVNGSLIEFLNKLSFTVGESGEGSDGIRTRLTLNSLYIVFKTMGFGCGIGQLPAWVYNHLLPYSTNGITAFHNWWLEILASSGVFIFIGYIQFYKKMLLENLLRFKWSKSQHEKAINGSIFVFMCGYIVACISSSSNFAAGEWTWVFWGLCICWQSISFLSTKALFRNISQRQKSY